MGPAAKQEPETERLTARFTSSERSGLTTAEVRCRPFCAGETVTCATASPPHSRSNALENPAADMKANAQTPTISQRADVCQVFFIKRVANPHVSGVLCLGTGRRSRDAFGTSACADGVAPPRPACCIFARNPTGGESHCRLSTVAKCRAWKNGRFRERLFGR